ncbi:MAG TPA: TauD/TfdA family dioxygenase [Steroidobacteraceae bacterium]|jgi:gamma-butyrobetaine dioxygenase|nr:TauD/TfdA family dioxygenase [Steroidobacteraceae bacterium]
MSARGAIKRVSATPESLALEWSDGTVHEFAGIWLRDNLPEHRDPHSGQRLIDVADLPDSPRIRSASARDGAVHIEWHGESGASCFDLAWLESQAKSIRTRRPELAVRHWLQGSALAASDFAWATFARARDDRAARLAWLTRLLQDGVAFLSEAPGNEGGILEAMRIVGQVAETNYGLVFDVRSVPQPENLAYSDLGLGLHTDNPYREPVPGFQALHALIASPDGGDSLFADGFALAEHLRATRAEDFALLSRTAVPFHYRSGNAELYAERPLIQLSCRGEVTAVHYNSRSIAPLDPSPPGTADYYAAYRRFAALLRDPRYQLKFKLADGEIVVFDNQRILHGRSAFSSARHARHLRGCYLTRDSVYSSAAVLRRELDP